VDARPYTSLLVFLGETNMNAFHIHYRNTQGTLMRILTAVSRRGIEVPYVNASPVADGHRADLLLEVNPKQIGQLCRDWHAIVDVTDVRVGVPTPQMMETASEFAGPQPPASAGANGKPASAATA
jgi:acetolactate synthase regulatory subunit